VFYTEIAAADAFSIEVPTQLCHFVFSTKIAAANALSIESNLVRQTGSS
jgi:hypothetical protein